MKVLIVTAVFAVALSIGVDAAETKHLRRNLWAGGKSPALLGPNEVVPLFLECLEFGVDMYPCNTIETVAAAHRDKNTGEGRLSGRVKILVSISDSTASDGMHIASYASLSFRDGVPSDNPQRGHFHTDITADYLLYCCEAS